MDSEGRHGLLSGEHGCTLDGGKPGAPISCLLGASPGGVVISEFERASELAGELVNTHTPPEFDSVPQGWGPSIHRF